MERIDGSTGVRMALVTVLVGLLLLSVAGVSVSARPPPQAVCGVCTDDAFGGTVEHSEAVVHIRDDGSANWTVHATVDERTARDYRGLREAIETIETLGGDVLGLSFGGSDGGDVSLAGDLVDLLLDVREAERDAGNYERADELRDELEALGVEVQDTDDGPTYRL